MKKANLKELCRGRVSGFPAHAQLHLHCSFFFNDFVLSKVKGAMREDTTFHFLILDLIILYDVYAFHTICYLRMFTK